MQRVENASYYHIQRNLDFPAWKKGEIINIGDTYNNYYDNHINSNHDFVFRGDYYKGSSLNDVFHNIRNGLIKISELDMKVFLDDLNSSLEFNLRLNREKIFEDIRLEINPELPSRMKCIFLVPNENSNFLLNHWYRELGNKGRIYKLKVTGVIHIVDSSLVNLTTRSPLYIQNQAEKYWIGSIVDETIPTEALFIGNAFVEDTITSPNSIVTMK